MSLALTFAAGLAIGCTLTWLCWRTRPGYPDNGPPDSDWEHLWHD